MKNTYEDNFEQDSGPNCENPFLEDEDLQNQLAWMIDLYGHESEQVEDFLRENNVDMYRGPIEFSDEPKKAGSRIASINETMAKLVKNKIAQWNAGMN